ncbi:MAG: ATP-binding protein [Blastocatellia bacterium]|nr:ATP-binding protein [Blastocatellia bacterium]
MSMINIERKKLLGGNEEEVSQLPHWAATLVHKYNSGEASRFLLYNNIYDLIWLKNSYVNLVAFLGYLLKDRNFLLYNRSNGIQPSRKELLFELERAYTADQRVADPIGVTKKQVGITPMLPRDPARAIPYLEYFFYEQWRIDKQEGEQFYGECGVVINFLESIIPATEVSYMSGEDRSLLVTFQKWLTTTQDRPAHNPIIYITENVSDVHPRIRENPRLVNIEIPYPNQEERMNFIRYFRVMNPTIKFEMGEEQLAHMSSGLNRTHLTSMIRSASINPEGLTYEIVRNKKKEIIESECVGLVEFVTPKYGLEHVGGMSKAKEFLRNIAKIIKEGLTEEAPMGILISGPVGTGKTFLAECFAKDCGLNVIEFKNFREKWVGSTESNLERILNLLQTLAPIVVLIDEADATLGTRDTGGGDSGVDARIFSKIANSMGNTENRGKILWILMTCRPDLLPIDLKRQGRCEEHISLFYPETEEDRSEITEAMVKKNRIENSVSDWTPLTKHPLELSGADIEAILIRCRRVARNAGRKVVTQEDLVSVANEFIPARDETAVEYQTLVAVRESTSKEMLPEAYRNMTAMEVAARIEQLRPFVR